MWCSTSAMFSTLITNKECFAKPKIKMLNNLSWKVHEKCVNVIFDVCTCACMLSLWVLILSLYGETVVFWLKMKYYLPDDSFQLILKLMTFKSHTKPQQPTHKHSFMPINSTIVPFAIYFVQHFLSKETHEQLKQNKRVLCMPLFRHTASTIEAVQLWGKTPKKMDSQPVKPK